MIIRLEVLVKGTELERRLAFAKTCYLQGVCSETEYKKERVAIAEEVKKEIEQQYNHYRNLAKGEIYE